jgi:hypothetical protein
MNDINVNAARDFETVGTWSAINADGEIIQEGNMLSETVKYKDKDGVIRLGKDWVADTDKHVTGFDP